MISKKWPTVFEIIQCLKKSSFDGVIYKNFPKDRCEDTDFADCCSRFRPRREDNRGCHRTTRPSIGRRYYRCIWTPALDSGGRCIPRRNRRRNPRGRRRRRTSWCSCRTIGTGTCLARSRFDARCKCRSSEKCSRTRRRCNATSDQPYGTRDRRCTAVPGWRPSLSYSRDDPSLLALKGNGGWAGIRSNYGITDGEREHFDSSTLIFSSWCAVRFNFYLCCTFQNLRMFWKNPSLISYQTSRTLRHEWTRWLLPRWRWYRHHREARSARNDRWSRVSCSMMAWSPGLPVSIDWELPSTGASLRFSARIFERLLRDIGEKSHCLEINTWQSLIVFI